MPHPIDLAALSRYNPPFLAKEAANTRYYGPASAKMLGIKTAFLCHSHNDRPLVEKLILLFAAAGIDLYVDWQDHTLPPQPTRETAEKIQTKIRDLDLFLYLATQNSSSSKWCPWEIGYGDAAKGKDKVLIIPTHTATGTAGQEYLSLYLSIQIENNRLVRFDPRTRTTVQWTV
jgi:hypothetical protein